MGSEILEQLLDSNDNILSFKMAPPKYRAAFHNKW
jgi:hypothetical protein